MRANKIEGPLSVARMDRVRPKVNFQQVLKHCSGHSPSVRPSRFRLLHYHPHLREMFEWPDSPICLSSAVFPSQCGFGKEYEEGGDMVERKV